MDQTTLTQPTNTMDFRCYEAAPGISVIVLPDTPVYTHLAVSHDFIRASGMKREEVIGKGHFDVFPKSPSDPNFTGEQNLRASFEYIIKHKEPHGIPVQRYDIPNGDGTFRQKYWKITNAPILSHAGEVLYIIHSAIDITDQVLAEQKVESTRGIEKSYNLFMTAPMIIGIVRGDDYIIDLANEGLLQVWGRTEDVIGKPLTVAIPELAQQGLTTLLNQVRTTGEAFYAYEYPITLVRHGREEVLYFDFVYKPFYENGTKGKATGVISVGHDVTDKVLARKKLEEVTERLNFRNALFEAQNETTPDGVLIVDAKGKIILYNRRFAQIWNMPPEIIDSKDDDAALRHAMTMLKDPEGFLARVTELYKAKREKSYDQILFKDGRTIERFGTSITAEDGLYYGWAWYFRDISERKKQEEEIETQNVLIRTITDNATSTLFMMNAKGYCTFMNAAGEKMFGYSQEEIRSKPLHYLIHHHRPDGSFYPMEECPLDRALPDNFDVRAHRDLFFRKDGTSFPVSCAASPIFEDGVPVATVIEVRDITLELEAEQSLRRSAAELEQLVGERTQDLQQLNEQLQQFTYAASHDLQEPLRKITFFLERLLSNIGPTLSENDKRIAERIEHTIRRMQGLIRDLLDYSNTTLGTIGFEEVALDQIVKEVLNDMEATILQSGAVINQHHLPSVKGDHRQLRQLFQNLISNALKYHKKELPPQVQISSKRVKGIETNTYIKGERKNDSFYLIEVKDNGIGFDPDDADRIFRLFQRLHGRSDYEGTGVGLAIVQKVVENHNGYIWAESKPGEGATFNVLLPET
ncbi:PAS domain S-box protein [Flavisolibacter sp. BT320]|nr:PAS domain S-box protein [Flavisolibacter longurius]